MSSNEPTLVASPISTISRSKTFLETGERQLQPGEQQERPSKCPLVKGLPNPLRKTPNRRSLFQE